MKRGIIQKSEKHENLQSRTNLEICDNESLEKIKQESFMEGYKYAIQVLEESLVKRKKTK